MRIAGARHSPLSILSPNTSRQIGRDFEANLQAALAALSEVLQSIKKRTHAQQHQPCLRVTGEKVPSPVVAFAELKAAQR